MRKTLFLLSNSLIVFWFQIYIAEGIIDGQLAQPTQFKYAASLQAYMLEGNKGEKVKRNVCSGVIISDDAVLSAAHCVISSSSEFTDQVWSVIAGVTDPNENDHIEVNVEKIIVPSDYDPKQVEPTYKTSIYSDISYLKLEKKLGLAYNTHRLIAVDLPELFTTAYTYEGDAAILCGFGLSMKLDDIPSNSRQTSKSVVRTPLHFAEVDIVSNSECQLMTKDSIRHDHVCGHLKRSQPTTKKSPFVTKGDGGGPLVINGNLLIGILSHSRKSRGGKYSIEIYTKVSFYVALIRAAKKGQKTPGIRVAIYENRRGPSGYRKMIKEI